MNFRLEPWHINRGQVELALIHTQDSDSFPPPQMPVVKLSIAYVAAGLKGHCPLVIQGGKVLGWRAFVRRLKKNQGSIYIFLEMMIAY